MGNISICVCVEIFFFFFGRREGNLIWALSTLETDLCWSNNVFKMLLLVEIAVNVSPCSDLRVPSSSVPSVDMALDDIDSNCTLKAANRNTVWRSETGEVEWKFRVVPGANWNSNFRATFQRLTISVWGMHKCDSYFAGDDRDLLNIQECLLVFSRSEI